MELLLGTDPVPYDALDEIFTAFGLRSAWENPDKTSYYHPEFIDCGSFRVYDRYDWQILSPGQRSVVLYLLRCVEAYEKRRDQ